MMKVLRNIFRVLVGVVFIFSGFVKGVDPLGTVYRMQDYFAAFGMPWANPFALTLTIFLCMVEFIMGISLFFNLWIKGTSWILLPLMAYFTVLTFFDAFYNIVPDCGCFGEAIKLTNMQTFLKNVVLMVIIIQLFIWRKKFRSPYPLRFQGWAMAFFVVAFTWMEIHAYRHLPIIDFMGWRVGKQVNIVNNQPIKFYLTFKNVSTGEEKEYQSPNYPWSDSLWTKQWKYKSQRVVDPNKDNAMNLRVENRNGEDITKGITDNPDFQFILVANNLSTANKDAFQKIIPLYKQVIANEYSFACLTNALPAEIDRFRQENGIPFDFCSADDVVMKTMVRSNPGLILIKNGKVLAKWHYHDFPSYDKVMKKFRPAG